MFDNYRIGAMTPVNFTDPMEKARHCEAFRKWEGATNLARDTPAVARQTLKVANFITRNKGGTWAGYHSLGALPVSFPPQLNPKAPNNFADVPLPIFDPRANFVNWFLFVKTRALKEWGNYEGATDSAGKAIPITTPAMVRDLTAWLFAENQRLQRGHGLTEELRLIRGLRNTLTAVDSFFNTALAAANIRPESNRGKNLARTTIIPAQIATAFWDLARKQALRMNSITVLPGNRQRLGMLLDSFWKAARDLVKAAKKGGSRLLKFLKWAAIILAVGFGGLLILNALQLARQVSQ